MYYTYILLNEKQNHTDIGCTYDVTRRLEEHNSGKVTSSKPYRPYRILHLEEFSTLVDARRKEKFYKSTAGRREPRKLMNNVFWESPPRPVKIF